MTAFVEVLELSIGIGFVALAAFCLRRSRAGDRALSFAAAAFALMGLTMIATFLTWATDYRYPLLGDVTLVAFVVSGYPLLWFRRALLGNSEVVVRVMPFALGAVIVAIVGSDFPYGPTTDLTTLQYGLLMLGALLWSACVGQPAFAFARAARRRPAVQRARLRALSAGCVGLIIVALTWSGTSGIEAPGVLLAVHVFALAMIPVLYISFSPPEWLRRAWRAKEEALVFAAQDLAVFHPDERSLAEDALRSALRLVGADIGSIRDPSGALLAASGEDPAVVAPDGRVVEVPLTYDGGTGALQIVLGPLMPVFGNDELERLAAFASVVAVALDRVHLNASVAREKERYERLLQAVSDLGEGVLVTDGGRLVYANDAYVRMTGYSIEELRAFPSLLELAVAEDRPAIAARLASRLAGEEVEDHYESRLVRKDGTLVDVEAAVKLVRTNEGTRVVSVIRDITQRKTHERKLEELDALKNEFIGNAAHELRTPLTAIVGLAATLAARRTQLSEEDLVACIDGLDRGARRLGTLVNRLLDFTQIERGGLTVSMQRVALASAARDALMTLPAPDGVEVRLEVADDIAVWADPTRLDQILTNLISNAYRYGGNDVIIHAAQKDDAVIVEVVDDGPGVPPSVVAHLFDPFVRGSNDPEGSGLGLAIVHRLAEAFGGTVTYHPVRPHGARFRVRLKEAA